MRVRVAALIENSRNEILLIQQKKKNSTGFYRAEESNSEKVRKTLSKEN